MGMTITWTGRHKRPGRSIWWRSLLVAALCVVAPVGAALGESGPERGFNGFVRTGSCDTLQETPNVSIELEPNSDRTYVVEPYGTEAPSNEVYYGVTVANGFSSLSLQNDNDAWVMVITDGQSGDTVSCGTISLPTSDSFKESGTILVHLVGVGANGVSGLAVIRDLASGDVGPGAAIQLFILDSGTTPIASPAA